MIDLTPLDVRKKKEDFKRSVRGYDPVQVDAFLEVVSERLEQLVREHGSLSDRLEHLEGSLATYQERERALNEALLAAQELREEARSQAERDAAVRLREAETHAEAILLDADQAIRHSQRRLEDLRARRRQFLKSLRGMVERFDETLELEESRLEAESEDLGDLLERLQTDLGDVEAPARRGASPAPADPEVGRPAASAREEPPGPATPSASAPRERDETSRNGAQEAGDAAGDGGAPVADRAPGTTEVEADARMSTPIPPAETGGSSTSS